MPEISKPVDQLRALHKEDGSGDLKRPDILVVEEVEDVRQILVDILQGVFPGYNILPVSNGAEASNKISQELRESLALVFADTEDLHAVLKLFSSLRGTNEAACVPGHGKEVPIVFTSARIFEQDVANQDTHDGKILAKALERRDLDGFIGKPFAKDRLAAVLADSIAKRAGLFEELELAARGHVLGNFIENYNDLAQAWEEGLESLVPVMNESAQEDLSYLLRGVQAFRENLARMRTDIDHQALRKIIHDFNNDLTVLISSFAFILELEMSGSAKESLGIFKAEVQKLRNDIELIGQAVRGEASWASVEQLKPAPEVEQVLRCPEGTRFCVVDDNENVIKVCERVIKNTGGNLTLTISDGRGVSALFLVARANEKIDVFLLDHELGEGLFGYRFIEDIRTCYPDALIICHTGAAADLNEDAENPYRKAGIEVVEKRAWGDISGIIRRKFMVAADAEKSPGM